MILFLMLTLCVITTQVKSNCTCVPYYQCSEDTGNLITDGEGLLDMRGEENGECTGYFDVCCNSTILDPPKKTAAEHKGCGYRKNWSVAVLYQDKVTTMMEFKCGGSLIHPQVVVTAAHCLDKPEGYVIRIGDIIQQTQKIIIHPRFNLGTLRNDIALMILKTPIVESEYINVICIPPPVTDIDNGCTINDWRYKNFNKLTTELKIVSGFKCELLLRHTRLGPFFNLHGSFLCAAGPDLEDPCGNDGGSPLVCPVPGQPGRYHQVGIVSWGIGCGEGNVPGVYVNLGIFRDWIDEVMIEHGFSINGYRY